MCDVGIMHSTECCLVGLLCSVLELNFVHYIYLAIYLVKIFPQLPCTEIHLLFSLPFHGGVMYSQRYIVT